MGQQVKIAMLVRLSVVIGFMGWLSAAVLTGPVFAHEIRPAVVTATMGADGRYEVVVATNIEALLAGIGEQHKDTDDAPEARTYNALRALPPAELKRRFEVFSNRWLAAVGLEFDGVRSVAKVANVDVPDLGSVSAARISKISLAGAFKSDAKAIVWSYGRDFGSSVLRVKLANGELVEGGWLKDGAASAPIVLGGGAPTSKVLKFYEYMAVGFTHILPKGLDHILFVVGLYLLSAGLRPLLVQVTAFTVAHSITLALGLYGVVDVPSTIVEPLIALSIVYVAVENILRSTLSPWRPFVVFVFGLLHGLGFAGVLQEIGLGRGDYVVGLLGFNVGVEFGQLAVIALAWLATGYWFSERPWYRQRIVWPASAAIALVGLFWTVERIMSA